MKIIYIIVLITTIGFSQSEVEDSRIFDKSKIVLIKKDKNGTITTISDTKEKKKHISIVKKIGFSSKDGIVSIDTNKAKSYFSDLGKNIKDKSKQLSSELKSKSLKVTKDMGIELNKDSLNIDFNKTKEFAKSISKDIKVFANDINQFTKKIKAEINGSK
ncbi:hypothetical protein MNB_SV-15-73 [hydrothermal vent metagenome]|uniref:Uncharacterized protein n=1 Tax=hydrothermal vent metagenome TaxID=652676 RepID=A0A1W1EI68_9ZZZZ